MSRIGSKPITLPDGVTAVVEAGRVTVTGPRGELSLSFHPNIAVTIKENTITCTVAKDTKKSSAHWGTTRANLANLVTGVTEGFTKALELQGVGYKAKLQGKDLVLSLGYSHPIVVPAPDGVEFSTEEGIIKVSGIDVVKVGQIAADIRKLRKPEPYKGKGVRYVGERVRRKVGKVVGSTE